MIVDLGWGRAVAALGPENSSLWLTVSRSVSHSSPGARWAWQTVLPGVDARRGSPGVQVAFPAGRFSAGLVAIERTRRRRIQAQLARGRRGRVIWCAGWAVVSLAGAA